MWWWNIAVVLFLAFGVYAFLVLTGFNTKFLSRRTSRRTEDLYPSFRDDQSPDDDPQDDDRRETG